MPLTPDREFVRQAIPTREHVGMVIPPDAEMIPAIRQAITQRVPGFQPQPPSEPPTGFSFHYVDFPIHQSLLADGAVTDNGIYEFIVRDAVLGVFDLPAFSDDEFSWSFSSTAQLAVLAAVKIGETLDIKFESPFQRVYHVMKYHFPPSVPDSGYGKYPIHITVDGLTPIGFRMVSSFEPGSPTTQSRLPFFFGFRVFGRFERDPEFPAWRELLAHAVRQLLSARWDLGLLYSAFALESFIDQSLTPRLDNAGLGEDYIEHVLRVADRRYELLALNNFGPHLSKSQASRVHERLSTLVFSPRNALAHGKTMGTEITPKAAVDSIKASIEFIWDWAPLSRQWLLARMRPIRFEDLIDASLLQSCGVTKGSAA